MPASTYPQQVHQRFKDCLEKGCTTILGDMKLFATGMERMKWAIKHYSDKWGDSTEYYEDIDECVSDFLALLKTKPGAPQWTISK